MRDQHMDDSLHPLGTRLHVAIIMDGNGRWATARGLARSEGHRAGRAAVRETVEAAFQYGIGTLTLFTFSTENWGRPKSEVAELMHIFEEFFALDAAALSAEGLRISVVGRRDRLPLSLCAAIERAEMAGVRKEGMHVRLALDYSGREAIVRAARDFSQASDASAQGFARVLGETDPEGVTDIDLLIRTGGELRLSNCPLWEIAYAELYFTPCLWPDFGAAELGAALDEFRMRNRRFGRLPAMVVAE